MSARKNHSELDFGSDSFLDIIANIVGILIILIVIAGVKVMRQPVALPQRAPSFAESVPADSRNTKTPAATREPAAQPLDILAIAKPWTPQAEPAAAVFTDLEPPASIAASPDPRAMERVQPMPVESLLDSELASASEPNPIPEPVEELIPPVPDPIEIPQPPEPIVLKPSDELLDRQASLESAIASTRAALEATAGEQQESQKKHTALAAQLVTLTREADDTKREIESRRQQSFVIKREIANDAKTLERRQSQLEEASREQVNVERLEHELTPVGEEVTGDELHFRIIDNKVSFVPIIDLLDLLRDRIQQQRDWLMRFPRHQGVVGPINGYAMRYTVERARMSVLDELRYGSNIVRIAVTEWKIEVVGDERAETLEEALQPGSRLAIKLARASADSTLTFWTYPDSFNTFREIQSFARAHDFRVAGRPIPFGSPIAGSPRGSRSTAQ